MSLRSDGRFTARWAHSSPAHSHFTSVRKETVSHQDVGIVRRAMHVTEIIFKIKWVRRRLTISLIRKRRLPTEPVGMGDSQCEVSTTLTMRHRWGLFDPLYAFHNVPISLCIAQSTVHETVFFFFSLSLCFSGYISGCAGRGGKWMCWGVRGWNLLEMA